MDDEIVVFGRYKEIEPIEEEPIDLGRLQPFIPDSDLAMLDEEFERLWPQWSAGIAYLRDH